MKALTPSVLSALAAVCLTSSLQAFPSAQVYCSLLDPAPGTGSIFIDTVQGSLCYQNVPGTCLNTMPITDMRAGSLVINGLSMEFDEIRASGTLDDGRKGFQWIRIYRDRVFVPTIGFVSVHGADFVGDLFNGEHFFTPRSGNLPQSGDSLCTVNPVTH